MRMSNHWPCVAMCAAAMVAGSAGAGAQTPVQMPVAAPAVADESRSVVWRVDAALQRSLQSARADDGPAVVAATRALNWWGGTGVIVFAAVLWLGGRLAGIRPAAIIGLRGAEGIAIASALSGIIKGLAGRSRPFLAPGEPWQWDFNHGWSDARYFSMPSGHTTATMAFAVAAAIAAVRLHRARGTAFGVIVIASAVCVGISRMYTNQHWLSDVVVGTALGAGTAIALARLHSRTSAPAYHRVMLGGGTANSERDS